MRCGLFFLRASKINNVEKLIRIQSVLLRLSFRCQHKSFRISMGKFCGVTPYLFHCQPLFQPLGGNEITVSLNRHVLGRQLCLRLRNNVDRISICTKRKCSAERHDDLSPAVVDNATLSRRTSHCHLLLPCCDPTAITC